MGPQLPGINKLEWKLKWETQHGPMVLRFWSKTNLPPWGSVADSWGVTRRDQSISWICQSVFPPVFTELIGKLNISFIFLILGLRIFSRADGSLHIIELIFGKLLPLVSPAVGSGWWWGAWSQSCYNMSSLHSGNSGNDRPMRAFNDFLPSCCRGEKWKRFLSQWKCE